MSEKDKKIIKALQKFYNLLAFIFYPVYRTKNEC